MQTASIYSEVNKWNRLVYHSNRQHRLKEIKLWHELWRELWLYGVNYDVNYEMNETCDCD
ncbi:24677_t:CDS:2 [Gigaspora margarita]|uniref:24677_t:CDS:1 n=1 Tax=Gigaspora margarita TaxID=4874 RepID=A0ABM8VX11_GIGMA|nr:24677_t:CDS:2 [Gigaspora margarita]